MVVIEELLDEKVKNINQLKKEGNTLFGEGSFSKAIEKYEEALVECVGNMELRSILNSNIAAAYIKLEMWTEAIASATEAIETGAINEKALERRAFANYRLDNIDDAIKDYKQILESHPNRKDLCLKLAECENRNKVKMEDMKNDLLEKLKCLGNACLKPFGLSTDNFEMKPNGDGYSFGMKKQKQEE